MMGILVVTRLTSSGMSGLHFPSKIVQPDPVGIDMFKVNNRNTRTRCEIYSKLPIKTPERRPSSVSIVNFEHVIADWGGFKEV